MLIEDSSSETTRPKAVDSSDLIETKSLLFKEEIEADSSNGLKCFVIVEDVEHEPEVLLYYENGLSHELTLSSRLLLKDATYLAPNLFKEIQGQAIEERDYARRKCVLPLLKKDYEPISRPYDSISAETVAVEFKSSVREALKARLEWDSYRSGWVLVIPSFVKDKMILGFASWNDKEKINSLLERMKKNDDLWAMCALNSPEEATMILVKDKFKEMTEGYGIENQITSASFIEEVIPEGFGGNQHKTLLGADSQQGLFDRLFINPSPAVFVTHYSKEFSLSETSIGNTTVGLYLNMKIDMPNAVARVSKQKHEEISNKIKEEEVASLTLKLKDAGWELTGFPGGVESLSEEDKERALSMTGLWFRRISEEDWHRAGRQDGVMQARHLGTIRPLNPKPGSFESYKEQNAFSNISF